MKLAPFMILVLIASTPVLAKDLKPSEGHLELFPKGRASYQEKFDARREQYEVNGRNYIDDLYDTHGESNASPSEPMLPESTLDAVLDGADKQNIAAQKNKAAVMKPANPIQSAVSMGAPIPPVDTSNSNPQ